MTYRNLLFVPGHDEKYYNSVRKYNPDAVILDLEDAVPGDYKEQAINLVNKKIDIDFFKELDIYIRINHESKSSMIHDLSRLNLKTVVGIMLPKIENKEEVVIVDSFLNEYERKNDLSIGMITIILLIESPLGLINLPKVVNTTNRIKALAFGSEDYCRLMKGERTESTLDYPRKTILTYARAYDLKCYDTVFPDLAHPELLKEETKIVRSMGFDGKLVVHPAQIRIVNAEFDFDESELIHMRKVIDEFEAMQDKSVLVINGQIIEKPHVARYKEILNNNHY